MSIADEMAAFRAQTGVRCGINLLSESHPEECADLWEVIRSPEIAPVVMRWWNQTRAERTGLRITDQTVRRHRGRMECTQCR